MAKAKNNIDPMMAVLANIEKAMGNKGAQSTFARFGNIEREALPVISFGIPAIDAAGYCGGVPRGKMVEIYGPESSGKSLLSLFLIANAQKQGLECALLDVEQSFDPDWAKTHGVLVDKLVYSSDFDSGENAMEYAYQLCRSGAFAVVVVDSTAALIPKAELEGTLEKEARIGAQARLMSQGCRKIVKACGEGNTTCVFINQVRTKIGVMYGNPETTPGGLALKFYSHQRIRVAKQSQIKVKENGQEIPVGQISGVTFVKNKTARPFGKAEFRVIFDSKSLNPVVMLGNALRSQKLLSTRNGLLRIAPDVLDNDKPIDTGAANMVELADFLISNKYVIPLLDALLESVKDDPTAETIDDAILEMKTDASKIVSPKDTNISFEAKLAGDDPHAADDELAEAGHVEAAE